VNTNNTLNDNHKAIPTEQSKQQDVVIIGGGWSGLASAVHLADHGYQVTLLESARQLGGKARSVSFKGAFSRQTLDNGQHIMLGAYHYTRNLLKLIGQNEQEVLVRQPLELKMYSPQQNNVLLKTIALPAPLHLFWALLTVKGIGLIDRLRVISLASKLATTDYRIYEDINVADFLQQHKQPSSLIKALWEPLCLATLNTPMTIASTQVFLNVLKDSFSHQRRDSDFLFFTQDLDQFFCQPARRFILKKGGQIVCSSKVTTVLPAHSHHFSVVSSQHSYRCRNVIIATPASVTKKLLQRFPSALIPEAASLNFNYEPICTVYLQYPEYFRLPAPMVGFTDTLGQWAIDRSLYQQAGLIAVVISGPGKHLQLSNKSLAETLHLELKQCLDTIPELLYYQVVIEKKATFSCHVNVQRQRPSNQTHIDGLFLAGDYTDTNYPATLEGAIKSGIQAAKQVINRLEGQSK
jgi:squalene-associated FAD-dependent desaturase